MSRKVGILLILSLALLHAAVYGQSAERVDAILAADPLSAGDAAYLAVMSSGLIQPDDGAAEALVVLQRLTEEREHRDRFPTLDPGQDATLGEFAYMVMLAHGMNGGFWYRRLPGPRYAYREFAYRRLVQGQAYALQPLSGERAMRITGRVLAAGEVEQ